MSFTYFHRHHLTSLIMLLLLAVPSYAATLNFQDVDGASGSSTLAPSDVWNSGSKAISNFGGVVGLTATVSSSSSAAQWNNQSNFHFSTTNKLWLSAADSETVNLTLSFSHPISGSIDTLSAFGDASVPEGLTIAVTGSGATITDGSGKSSTSGTTLTYASEGGTNFTSLLTYSDVSSIVYTYTCSSASGGCGSLLEDWVIDEVLLSSSTPADNATSVAVDANIVLNFSEAVDAESGNITIKKTSDNSTIETIDVTSGQVTGSGSSTITINPTSNLSPSTEFYVLIADTAFDNANGQSYSGISSTTALSFTTASAPTVTTQAVSSITSTSATGNGNITALGSTNPTAHGVCYGTSANPTSSTGTCTDEGAASATGAFTSALSGLTSGQTYYVRAYATNSAGTSYGSDVTFTTLSGTDWVNWTMPSSYPKSNTSGSYTYATSASGTVTDPNTNSTVNVTLSGEILDQSSDTATWVNGENPSSAFDIGTVTSPDGEDLITQSGYTTQADKHHTITFDTAVDGVVMGIWSLGGGQVSSLLFSEDFEIIDTETSPNGLTRTVTSEGYKLTGTAVSGGVGGAAGLIQFYGSNITSITYTVTEPEFYSGMNVALTTNTLSGSGGATKTIDVTAPTIAITAAEVNDGDTSGDTTLSLTFTLSESSTNFAAGDITVTNGVISSFTGSGTTYTATFTPSAVGATTIDVAAGTFTDATGNANTAASQFNWTYASDSTSPSIVITAANSGGTSVANGSSTDDATLTVTFTVNETVGASPNDFVVGDVTVVNGALTNFARVGSTNVYTATLTPTHAGLVTIDVAAASFKDTAGNDNSAATQFAWTYGVDPTTKADVVGGLKAAVNSATTFSRTSLKSVEMRMDWLRRHKDEHNKSVQGINVAFADPLLNQFVNGNPRALEAFKLASAQDVLQKYGQNPDQVMSDVQSVPIEIAMAEAQEKFGKVDLNPTGGKVVGDWFMWTAGQITIGKSKNSSSSATNESEALNLAIGMDKSDKDSMFGFAVNGSKDMTDIGTDGSKQKSYGASLSIYGGFNADSLPPMEFILGVGHMDIKSTRIDGSQTLTGSRDARTVFGSVGVLSEAIEYRKTTITPYSKLEAAYIDLGSYSESGGTLALSFDNQIVKQAMLKVGVDTTYETEWYNGKLTPFTRFEYAYDFSPSSNADMHYVGDSTNYRLTTDKNAVSNWTLRLGSDYAHTTGASTSVFYERTESINSGHSDSVQLKVSIPF